MKRNFIPAKSNSFINSKILEIRGRKLLLDRDLAEIYGVATKRLNEQVKRNRSRFPEDFMIQLSKSEKEQLVANCDHLRNLKFSSTRPYAFSEHGALMAANVLNTKIAIKASVQVIRAFIHFREVLSSHKDLTHKIQDLEKKYDSQFKVVFDAIRQLMSPPQIKKRRIGFAVHEDARYRPKLS